MATYYITIFLVLLFTYIAQNNIIRTTNTSNNQIAVIKPSITKTFFVFSALVLIFVAGFRYFVGTDYGAYFVNHENYASDFWENLFEFDEPGYSLISLIALKLNLGSEGALFIAAAITNILFLTTIYKNTDMLLPAILLYIFLGCWHGAFNGVRQYCAAAIVFAGLHFIKERKFWKYAFVVFIAFLFHSSAILMIFLYFVAYNKINFRNILFLIFASLIILFSFTEVLNFAGFITGAENDYASSGEYITNSVNILRVLVAIAPAVFFLILYQKRAITREQQFWLNMLIINGVMMFATSNSTYLARMGIYTAPFSAIGIPELIKGISPKDKKVVTALILLAFAAFWLYEISNSSALREFEWVFGRV